jgi:hypothetical protein
MKRGQIQFVLLFAVTLFFGVSLPAQAKKAIKKIPLSRDEMLTQLQKRAETYAKFYEKRKFKELYDFVNAKYKRRVSRAMYEDYITFPGETDKYFLVTVEMCDVMDDITLGKVIFKISTFGKDHLKGVEVPDDDNSTGELESEFMETTDWVYENGNWHIVERYDK